MSKRLIALAVAGAALTLTAAFYARVRIISPSNLLTLSAAGSITNVGTNEVLVHFAESPPQATNSLSNPDDAYIAYRHVFAHIYFEAHGNENQVVNTAVEFYKHSVPLNEDEGKLLAKIALESETRTLAVEDQAATIIKRFRDKIEAEVKSGRRPSPEPPEFQTLQKQRVRSTLKGRDELRKAFGDATFSRFDKFLKEGMNLRIEKAIPSPQNN